MVCLIPKLFQPALHITTFGQVLATGFKDERALILCRHKLLEKCRPDQRAFEWPQMLVFFAMVVMDVRCAGMLKTAGDPLQMTVTGIVANSHSLDVRYSFEFFEPLHRRD